MNKIKDNEKLVICCKKMYACSYGEEHFWVAPNCMFCSSLQVFSDIIFRIFPDIKYRGLYDAVAV